MGAGIQVAWLGLFVNLGEKGCLILTRREWNRYKKGKVPHVHLERSGEDVFFHVCLYRIIFGLLMIPWRKWGWGCKELIFPSHCSFCQVVLARKGQMICDDCLSRIQYLQSPICSCCGREFPVSSGQDHLCGTCLRRLPVYSWARAVVSYKAPVSHLLHRLKYKADMRELPTIAAIIAPFIVDSLHDFKPEADRVIPVPLFPSRLKKRGINQSLLLARIFFPEAGKALLVDTLIRIRDTPPQTTLDGAARRKNLRNAFWVRHPEAVNGRRVFLVDDVFTTGTTVIECSKALLAAGAVEICVVTVARVDE
jgi:ComF family protein